jgi:hypothetical protein
MTVIKAIQHTDSPNQHPMLVNSVWISMYSLSYDLSLDHILNNQSATNNNKLRGGKSGI